MRAKKAMMRISFLLIKSMERTHNRELVHERRVKSTAFTCRKTADGESSYEESVRVHRIVLNTVERIAMVKKLAFYNFKIMQNHRITFIEMIKKDFFQIKRLHHGTCRF